MLFQENGIFHYLNVSRFINYIIDYVNMCVNEQVYVYADMYECLFDIVPSCFLDFLVFVNSKMASELHVIL